MGTTGRKRGVMNRKREGVQASKKKKAAVEASPSNNRDDRLKARDEAKRREEAERSESVNGYGRGLGSFLTGGQQPDTAPPVTTGGGEKVALNEVGRGDDESCANPNCTIKVALPIAHTGVPVVKRISMLSVVKRQMTFTMCCAPTANHRLH